MKDDPTSQSTGDKTDDSINTPSLSSKPGEIADLRELILSLSDKMSTMQRELKTLKANKESTSTLHQMEPSVSASVIESPSTSPPPLESITIMKSTPNPVLPKPFYGKKSFGKDMEHHYQDPELFINQCEVYLSMAFKGNGHKESDKVYSIAQFLAPPASTDWEVFRISLPTKLTSVESTFTVNSFYEWIKERYTVLDVERKRRNMFTNFRQGQQSFADYYTEFQRLRDVLNPRPDDATFQSQVYSGMHTKLQNCIDMHLDIDSFDKWRKALHKIAEVVERESRQMQAYKGRTSYNSQPQVKNNGGYKTSSSNSRYKGSNGSNDSISCYNCKQLGHISRDCPRLGKREFNGIQTDSFKNPNKGSPKA